MSKVDAFARMDLRRRRAETLAHAALRKLDLLLENDSRSQEAAFYALLELFMDNGCEVLTDLDRQQIGLSPRDREGWTADEVRALEALRLKELLRPVYFLLPSDEAGIVSSSD